jgi:hypothetical protein
MVMVLLCVSNGILGSTRNHGTNIVGQIYFGAVIVQISLEQKWAMSIRMPRHYPVT